MSSPSLLPLDDLRLVVMRRASAAMEHLHKAQHEILAASQDLARIVHATPVCRDLYELSNEAMRLCDRINEEWKAEGSFRWQLEASYTPSPSISSRRHECELQEVAETRRADNDASWTFARQGDRKVIARRRNVSASVSIGGTKRAPVVHVKVTSRDGDQPTNVAAHELAAAIFNQIPGYPIAEASVRRAPHRLRSRPAVVTITGPGAVLEAVRYFGEGLGPAIGITDPRDHAWSTVVNQLPSRAQRGA